ncbi:hypothetical protein ANO14919_001420 [Xylariales sp. No.14919]|nr:hypothetical protein ANO14919_001420 [Xylariales sp. No.14919]
MTYIPSKNQRFSKFSYLAGAIAVVSIEASVEDDRFPIGVNVEPTRPPDALVIDGAQEDAAVGVSAVNGARESILDVVVVARIAVRAVEQDVVPVRNLVQRRRLHDAVVRCAFVIQDRARAIQKRERISCDSLDYYGSRLVSSRWRAPLAGSGSSKAVAVHLPQDPTIDAIVVAGRVNNATTGVIADQGRALWRERPESCSRCRSTDAMGATALPSRVVHYSN